VGLPAARRRTGSRSARLLSHQGHHPLDPDA
jgi:hypothetical protein